MEDFIKCYLSKCRRCWNLFSGKAVPVWLPGAIELTVDNFFFIFQKCRRCWNRFSGQVVLLLLNAAGAAGCRALHGVGGRVERGAGGGLVARPVVYQVLKRGICL